MPDLSSYLATQLGGALALGFPGIIAPLFFRRSRLVSVLSGVIAALILPIGAIYYDARPGRPEDHAVLLVLAALIGTGFGLLFYAIAGRRKVA
jgi:hypothetical protein